jgi:hypothetical protein
MMRVALCLGRVQAWYAAGYREGTRLEQIAILPAWLAFQGLFALTFAIAQRMAR